MKLSIKVDSNGFMEYFFQAANLAENLHLYERGGGQVKEFPSEWDAETPEKYLGKFRLIGDTWVEIPPIPDYPVQWNLEANGWEWKESTHKTRAKGSIDQYAESMRLEYITPGVGQAWEYQESYKQAKTKIADPEAEVPMVTATRKAGVMNPITNQPVQTDEEAAEVIVFMHGRWLQVGTMIREIRLSAKRQISEATTPEQVEFITAGAIEALQGFDLAAPSAKR